MLKKGDRVKVVTIRKEEKGAYGHYIGKIGTVVYLRSDGKEALYMIQFTDFKDKSLFYMDELRLVSKKHNYY